LGHRGIGHIGGPSTYLHAAHRRQVWADALRESGLPEGPMVEADFSAGGGAAATLEMLGTPHPPTAILYANDLMAVAGIAAARQRGVLVPDQLSVVGFDDSQISAYLTAPLTTVHTDVYGWGKAAATALLARTEGLPVADIFLPAAQFITRASTGPVQGRPRSQPTRRSATR
jgi:DNA-binding LacI/PurR family transcriptional regulator